MRFVAACSRSAATAVFGGEVTGSVLGVSHAALYVQVTPSSSLTSRVIAVLPADAARLPCGLLIAQPAARLALPSIAPQGDVTVGLGALRWHCSAGDVTVSAVRVWLPPKIPRLQPRRERLAQLVASLPGAKLPLAFSAATRLALGSADPVGELLGRGPGLTPSGDDLLTGFVMAAQAFGLDINNVSAKIAARAAGTTTALSAQLLESALAGEAVPEVVELIRWLAGSSCSAEPIEALTAVGHTSGVAMACGVALAAEAATSSSCSPSEPAHIGHRKRTNLETYEY